MNTAQKEQIRQHRMEGVTYEKIAVCLGLSVNTVKSFCQRNQLGGRKQHTSAKHTCKQCGVEVKQLSHRKEKKFCSDKCRLTWWNSHPEKMQQIADVGYESASEKHTLFSLFLQKPQILFPYLLWKIKNRRSVMNAEKYQNVMMVSNHGFHSEKLGS